MPLAATINATAYVREDPLDNFRDIYPIQRQAKWFTVMTAGGINVQDAATITDPDAEIVSASNSIIRVDGAGTLLMLRMKYDDGITGPTEPIIKVFGRLANRNSASETDDWMILANKVNNISVTIDIALSTDVSDGTWNWTHPHWDAHVWDLAGCNEVLIGVETALAATGTVNTATVEAKIM